MERKWSPIFMKKIYKKWRNLSKNKHLTENSYVAFLSSSQENLQMNDSKDMLICISVCRHFSYSETTTEIRLWVVCSEKCLCWLCIRLPLILSSYVDKIKLYRTFPKTVHPDNNFCIIQNMYSIRICEFYLKDLR